ncbi:chemotaxis protein CheW [Methanospirillum sp. J.3.6.1-F.2.7.3]|jgi:purine-binding chemotaxis protein CheW|uniref:Chemotaxis protein CheW n=1 Tax=Methanospirillum purgamenti TaxID=2834276 RepID=A0A8E7EII1_9EURY|nr:MULTISPECIES: chemotaxis protein CheW [Methanospirillum]MDX8550102.1 chemotaxis protein CheW [Methanospirillum hungatei]QVV87465.1 chemotaxis protein CheW [Methanospirillum sp. J.3.6.1-F.2.7.3]
MTGLFQQPECEDANILLERARCLAEPLGQKEKTGEGLDVLTFWLNGERYCVSMKYVREVTLLRALTTLPGTPDFILGIISIRGRVVSVTDLRVFFNLPRKGLSDYNKIIVLSGEGMEFAVLADQVDGVSHQILSHLGPLPETISGIGKDFLEGVFPGPLMLIKTEAVLSHPKLVVRSAQI